MLCAAQLLRTARKSPDSVLSIVMLNDAEQTGRGAAYCTTCADHLLNVPAKGMSGLAEDRSHFLRWLIRTGVDANPETFAPRMLYAKYLDDLLIESQRGLSDSLKLSVRRERVVNIGRQDGLLQIELFSGALIEASAIIVAVGNFAPSQHVFTSFVSLPCQGYHENPWDGSSFRKVKPTRTC